MSDDPDRIPEVDELDRLCQALHGFLEQNRFSWVSATSGVTLTSEQEKEILPHFERLADSVRQVRGKEIQGWPTAIRRAIPRLVETFDGITRRWGWEGIAQPDPVRSTYLEQCRAWVKEGLERPMYEAALSVSKQWDRPGPCRHDDDADEARRRGMIVTMSLEEALERVDPEIARCRREPHFGKCYPRLEEQEEQALNQASWSLDRYLTEIAQRRIRPPLQEQPPATTAPTEGAPDEVPPAEASPAAPSAKPRKREAQNAAVAKYLSEHPDAQSPEIVEKTGVPDGSIRKLEAWTTVQARRKAEKTAGKADALDHARPMTRPMQAAIPSKDADPAEIVTEREAQDDSEVIPPIEVLRHRFLDVATPGQKARLNRMPPSEQEIELKAWHLTGEFLPDERPVSAPLRRKLQQRAERLEE
jgi:hypothetical protein